jgi:uncharacterized damage-inducible protein DinB
MKEYFLKLYQYNAWANRKVIDCMKRQQVDHDRSLLLMSHLLSALFIWLNRIKGLPTSPFPLWEQYKLSELETMVEDSSRNWLEFIESTDNFNRQLSYNNYVGDPYINNVEQIMIHLVNHSTYHRGQIAVHLRENGYEPVNTDFITYDRVITGQLKD